MDATFSSLSISNILQMLSLERKSTYISITHDTKQGYVILNEGDVWDAQFEEMRGEEAVIYLLTHNEGTLKTEQGPSTITRTITTPLPGLLMAAAQKEDELALKSDTSVDIDLANKKLSFIPGFQGSLVLTLDGEVSQCFPENTTAAYFDRDQFSNQVRSTIMNWKTLLDLDNQSLFQLYGDQLSIFVLHLRAGHFFIVGIESALAPSKVGQHVQNALGI